MLARKADRKTNRELNAALLPAGQGGRRAGRQRQGAQVLQAAYDLDSTYLPTLLGRAALLYKMEDWDDACKIYQTILVHHRDTQKDERDRRHLLPPRAASS